MSFGELARRVGYPPGRELQVRELCRTQWGEAGVVELCVAAREALRYVRELDPRADADVRARRLMCDVVCVADELLRLARGLV